MPYQFTPNGTSRKTPYPLAEYLEETFPEITDAVAIYLPWSYSRVYVEGVESTVDYLRIDSSYFSMFDVKIVMGNRDFLIPQNNKVAITQDKARQLFGNENPIGKVVDLDGECTICAIVTGYSKQSNYPFDFLCPYKFGTINGQIVTDTKLMWRYSDVHTLIKLAPAVDVESFKKKLYSHKIMKDNNVIEKLTITPLTSIHYEDPNIQREIKLQHVFLFALAGSLVILCTLFNYLTLFTCRFRMRQRELALRMVCGASGRSLLALLSIEFLMSLTVALLLGLVFIKAVLLPFQSLSAIKLDLSAIYLESILYIVALILLSLLVFLLVLLVFRRSSLNMVIRKWNTNLFRKMSIIVQLIISIGFAFCTIVIVKQMYYLHNTDLGFAFKDRGVVALFFENIGSDVLENQLKQIPEISETVSGFSPLLPMNSQISREITKWDGKPGNVEKINIGIVYVSEKYMNYYDFKLIEGEMLSDNDDKKQALISESAVKAFGWDKPLGKLFDNYTVKGVIKNIYNFAPTFSIKPYCYIRQDDEKTFRSAMLPTTEYVLFKYNEGARKSCTDKIKKLMEKEYPNGNFNISNAEDEYDKFFKSENALLKLLSFVSLICIIICIFGFVSLVSLTCEERRKEIAIRKINGATMYDILNIFFKEYFSLLIAGAVVAFPIGNYIMRTWLEQYVIQTSIPAWIYLSILSALVFVIVLCVGWRVYKASVENPADVIK
jgi:ABC-type antimicrobial peptide transport system permease subunit